MSCADPTLGAGPGGPPRDNAAERQAPRRGAVAERCAGGGLLVEGFDGVVIHRFSIERMSQSQRPCRRLRPTTHRWPPALLVRGGGLSVPPTCRLSRSPRHYELRTDRNRYKTPLRVPRRAARIETSSSLLSGRASTGRSRHSHHDPAIGRTVIAVGR